MKNILIHIYIKKKKIHLDDLRNIIIFYYLDHQYLNEFRLHRQFQF